MTNIAELLKDCPKGTKLYSPLFGEVKLDDAGGMIYVTTKYGSSKCFTETGCYYVDNETFSTECLLFPGKGQTWSGIEIKRPYKKKFNVGDWITDGNATAQIASIGNGWYLYGDRCILGDIKDVDKNYHLWSIEDAKVGNVLSNNNVICIFTGLDKDNNIFSPCMYTSQHGLEIFSSGEECMGSTLLRPATQKDCDILFNELEEAGYRWDENKCELVLLVKQLPKHNDKKNKHYDINNFYAGMEVLVRDGDDEEWNYLHFSHYRKKLSDHFFAGGNPWFQCIPFNNDTKHLLGTTDMPSVEYINW